MDNCLQNHPRCRAAQHGFTPSRLLQLDCFPGSKDVRLIDFGADLKTEQVPVPIPYATLSHCWGLPSKRPIRTLKDNIAGHRERIGFENLSKTFRDAVQAVRGMRLSYLWIDSLCIIQDDGQDWEQEAVQMAKIYRESVCTVSALSSDDGDGGCRVNARNEPVNQLRYVDLDIGEYRIRLVETEDNTDGEMLKWDVEYGDDDFKFRAWGRNPLRTRAWTFQERELSVRAIHFSKQTLLWECLEMKASTEVPHGVGKRYDEIKPELVRMRSPDTETKADAGQREYWYGKVEDYSSRFLTCESDKLIAIAGFAEHFRNERLKGGTY